MRFLLHGIVLAYLAAFLLARVGKFAGVRDTYARTSGKNFISQGLFFSFSHYG